MAEGRFAFRLVCVLFFLIFSAAAKAGDVSHGGDSKDNKPAPETEEGLLKAVTIPKELKVDLWTTSPKQTNNPVAICFDDQNRMYVAETHRFRLGGGLDVREVKYLYYEDFKSQTTADRLAIYAKYKDRFAPDYFTKYKERIVILEDTQNKGKADKASTFIEAFNDPLDGPGTGIAFLDNKIYYTCAPRLWELTGATGNTPCEKQNVMFDGMGIRLSISGHDLHGIVVGPEGKLYWSLGDRGYNTVGKEGQKFVNPVSGGVFRCNPDGSDLELYYMNLRNPEELAFDEYGNLFTGDNNADIGDGSRVVYILEGGNSAWSAGCQLLTYGEFPKLAGLGEKRPNPWLVEGLWKLRFDKQPAYVLPPVGLVSNGPSGLAYYPGTGLNDSYAHHFFLCDYTSGSNSGVHSFINQEEGAGFVTKEAKKFAWGITCTDVAFGYDGRMYIADYGGGWGLPGKGRIFTVFDPATLDNPAAKEVRKLFADGIGKLDTSKLVELLGHVDMRVRQRAQFEIAKRKEALATFTDVAKGKGTLLSRLHAVWGLGQLSRQDPAALKVLADLVADSEPRIREQSAKMLGDARNADAGEKLLPLLKDSNLRVKSLASIALGRMKYRSALPGLIQILRDNDDKDAYLRHSAVMGLVGIGEPSALEPFIKDESKAVRMGVLLAYRRMKEPRIAAFLKDSDPLVYAEAIRAIYDEAIEGAMPQLAAQLKRMVDEPAINEDMTTMQYLRLINGAHRYGNNDNAVLLAEFAANAKAPEEVRSAALEMLGKWEEPTTTDPCNGLYRPVPKHEKLVPNDAVKAAISRIMATGEGEIAAKATELAFAFGIGLSDEALLAHLSDVKKPESLRIIALQQLLLKKNKSVLKALDVLLAEPSLKIRTAALDAYLELDPDYGLKIAGKMMSEQKLNDEIKVYTDRTLTGWGALKMGAPSKTDYANQTPGDNSPVFTYVKGFATPHKDAGADGEKLPRLNDGKCADSNDDTFRNTWLDGGESRILLDLKKSIDVGAVNTFSWHVGNRAPQHFTLWASDAEKPDAAAKDLSKEKDWKKIALVDTTPLKEGGMHGSTVFNGGGSLGKFRWLLWQNAKANVGTFYSEMDVYEKGTWSYQESSFRHTQQQVLLSLGRAKDPRAADILGEWMDKLLANNCPPEIHLELIEAAEMRQEAGIKKKLADLKAAIPATDKLAPFKLALVGGDAKCGEQIFQFHAAACIRCHRINNEGSDAGPKLAGVGTRLSREKILESLIDPSAVVVPGYGVASFKLKDNSVLVGSILEENDKQLVLKQADGKTVTIPIADIKKRTPPVSPMPPMETILKPREIRDLIEFLSAQR